MTYARQPNDTEYDQEAAFAREDREEARAAHRAEQNRDGADEIEAPRRALLDALIAYQAAHPVCSLDEAVRAIGADGITAQRWFETRGTER